MMPVRLRLMRTVNWNSTLHRAGWHVSERITGAMDELLLFLVRNLDFLCRDYGARFRDSAVSGPDALLILEMNDLRLRLVRDRSQLFLDFQSSHQRSRNEWFALDVVRRLITGEVLDSAELDEAKCVFLKEHMTKIANAFSRRNCEQTEKELHRFEEERAKRLFG